MLGALLLLSGLGAADAALLSLTPRAWLGVLVMLVAPLLAQLGFLGLVSRLVRPVPEIVTLTGRTLRWLKVKVPKYREGARGWEQRS